MAVEGTNTRFFVTMTSELNCDGRQETGRKRRSRVFLDYHSGSVVTGAEFICPIK